MDERQRIARFDDMYREAAGDPDKVPWHRLRTRQEVAHWLARERPDGRGRTALVVGCGLGDDAAALAEAGFAVTAFDLSETAVAWAAERHNGPVAAGRITFVAADLTAPPAAWAGAFDLVLEVYTLQAMPAGLRAEAFAVLPTLVRPGGHLLLICSGRAPGEAEHDGPPWPLLRTDLAPLTAGGLVEERFEEITYTFNDQPRRMFRVLYGRPAA
ncbi:MAG: methyltransferase domain-containing protein [Alphaproteobacteria bacterium]